MAHRCRILKRYQILKTKRLNDKSESWPRRSTAWPRKPRASTARRASFRAISNRISELTRGRTIHCRSAGGATSVLEEAHRELLDLGDRLERVATLTFEALESEKRTQG